MVSGAALVACTSAPTAFDREQGEAELSAEAPGLIREIELNVKLEGANGSEKVHFRCGLAGSQDAPPTVYVGRSGVATRGRREVNVDPAQVRKALEALAAIHFFDIGDADVEGHAPPRRLTSPSPPSRPQPAAERTR